MNQNPPPSILKLFDFVKSNQLLKQEQFLFGLISDKINLPYILEIGIICAKNKKINEALIIFEALGSKVKNDERIFYNLGLLYSIKGEYLLAISSYDLAIQINPNDVASIINKSQILIHQKKYDEANICLDKSIEINPNYPEAWSNKGIALNHLGLYPDALKAFSQAINISPNYFEAYANQSFSLLRLKKYFEAIDSCEKSIQIQPNLDALLNKGIALNELKKYDEAILTFDRALEFDPRSPIAFFGKGVAFTSLGKDEHAIHQFENALLIDPSYFEALLAKAFTQNKLKKYVDAIKNFDQALFIDDTFSQAYFGKAMAYVGLAQVDKAQLFFDLALEKKPNFKLARWAKAFATIPAILSSPDEIYKIREIFTTSLIGLTNDLLTDPDVDSSEIFETVASTQPFYLAYQNFNNKNILSIYGKLCSTLMNKAVPIQSISNHISTKEKIKIGIVGSHFRNHSVWHAITKGFINALNKDLFEIHLFSTCSYCDEETNFAKKNSNSFTQFSFDTNTIAQNILNASLDFLLYPEIGMHQITTQLASLRLAPIQIMAWGHPETSGLPTIDYFLSSELFEPPNATDNYSEKLIKLPNLGTYYVSVVDDKSLKATSLSQFPPNIPILICPGTPYKYHPESDWIFSEIAKNIGDCRFIFFNLEDPLASILHNRLDIQFSKVGLNSNDFISFMPWLSANDFHCLITSSTVMLDTLHFSGFNTVMQALECNLPVVSHEGNFLRGRLGSAILKRIGLTELIAKNEEQYVQLTSKLIQDNFFYTSVKDKIAKRKMTLYGDKRPVEAFEAFMINHSINS